ncbi:MAG: Helix-turn-helix domain protein [Syntrophorhabdus sp. PtaU1.Bin153]|nr:MAG: Helix-turn-helix domain protein [Syntrophorhabdus sp. PtaU1.Bin153]
MYVNTILHKNVHSIVSDNFRSPLLFPWHPLAGYSSRQLLPIGGGGVYQTISLTLCFTYHFKYTFLSRILKNIPKILVLPIQLIIYYSTGNGLFSKNSAMPLKKKPGFLRALKILSISRTNLYNLVKAGKIVPVKLGKRTLFTEDELSRFIDSLEKKD